MPNVTITQLPAAGPITGTELVPIVQNGQTVRTTAQAIAASPTQTQTFLTVNQEPTLPNSRALSGGTGIGLVDGGALSTLQITLNGASGSLEAASSGVLVKTGATTIASRTLSTSGAGLGVTNGNGVSGNPTFALTGLAASLANLGGVGFVGLSSIGVATALDLLGTANQITVVGGDATAGNVVFSLATNPVLPGTASVQIPAGNTAQRGVGVNGQLRYNTDTATFEGYANGSWGAITTGSGVTSINTGLGLTGGPITSSGTISIDTSVVATLSDAQTLTNKTINGPDNNLTNIANASLANSAITINGTSVSLGGSVTVTATASQALTIGTGLTGTSYNGSSAVTIAIDSTVATLTGSQTLTNKTISGSSNTLSNIGNSSLTNSSVTIGTTNISLGATSLTLGGLTTVTVTQDPTSAFELTTKQYVDGLASTGLIYHAPVQVATTQDLATQTGGTVTYNNGAAGVGATLTLSVALTTLDGYGLVNGDRILVKDEVNQAYNGVYTWATGGTVLTRATDADSYGTGIGDLSLNDYFFVQNGTVNKGSSYVVTTVGTITFGTTAITFAQFSTSQVYTAGTGLTLTGTQFSLTSPVTAALGGTGNTSYTTGDMLYASGTTAISKLGIGTSTYILTSGGTAPQWSDPAGITVGNATNAVNTGTTTDSTNATYYLVFKSATSGNLPELVNSSISCNPSTGKITGGIAGGTF